MCWPTSTLTPLPGVANSSQAVGTISGRCQESKMMNYEYPGDVDGIPVLGGENIPFFPSSISGQHKSADRFRKSVLSSLEWLISIRCYKWGPTEIGCFSEVVKDFMHWRACLAVWGLRMAAIEVMTSSFPSLGGQLKGSESLEWCLQEEQTQTSVHNICMATWLQLKWRRCGEVRAGGGRWWQ